MDGGNVGKYGKLDSKITSKPWSREAKRRCELSRKERDVVFSRRSTSGLLLF